MDFELFLKNIPKIQNTPLPASESHLKMAPMERIKMLKLWDYSQLNPKKAAVMALFYPKNDQTHLVLIQRTAHGVHSSQIALPGGKQEEQDPNLAYTAVRETQEEIGIEARKINMITPLSAIYVPPSNFLVHPYIGHLEQTPEFTLQADEVAQIIEVPLADFLSAPTTLHNIKASYSEFTGVPAYTIHGNIVWGATAMILSELKDVLSESFG